MAQAPLDPSLGPEYLSEAYKYSSKAEMARAFGLSPSTFDSRCKILGVGEQVTAIIASGRAEANLDALVPKAEIPKRTPLEPEASVTGVGSDVEPDIAEIRRAAERRFAEKSGRAERKLHQSIRFPHGPVAVFFVGDVHFGNAGTDVGRVFEEQEAILATPGSYVWLMGDLVDSFIMGRLIAENMKPSIPVWEQWQLARHYVNNFGKRLIALNSGNHDLWALKLTGIDYSREITPSGVLYDSDEVRATVSVGNHDFRVWTRHKWRGNSIYNATHGQERAARFDSSDADILVGAHTHRGAMAREFILDGRRKIAVQTGAYKVIDDYARSVGFEGNDSSTAAGLVLNDDGSFFCTSNIKAVMRYMKAVYRG